jgi:hypothetical protein
MIQGGSRMQHLPIGIHTFADIITGNFLYKDLLDEDYDHTKFKSRFTF